MNVRTQVQERQQAAIEASQSRAIAAREAESRPRNALERMAERYGASPKGLRNTLMNTVFSACRSDEEFMALTIVADAYDLNPFTKEIYAFPKKGGGIQPMISYDGWIKIMNNHPQTDGIEFNHTLNEKGDVIAVEGIFYRKDRSRPTKKMVYLKEFKKNTEPWNNSPNHMLDVRCLCHTVRIALGINAGVEGEVEEGVIIDGGALTAQSLPSRQSFAQELDDEIPNFDKQTGEVIERDASDRSVEDEETARALDANDGTLSDDNPTAAEGPADEDRGEGFTDEKPAWFDLVAEIRAGLNAAKTKTYFAELDAKFTNARAGLPDDVIAELDKLSATARKRVANSEV